MSSVRPEGRDWRRMQRKMLRRQPAVLLCVESSVDTPKLLNMGALNALVFVRCLRPPSRYVTPGRQLLCELPGATGVVWMTRGRGKQGPDCSACLALGSWHAGMLAV